MKRSILFLVLIASFAFYSCNRNESPAESELKNSPETEKIDFATDFPQESLSAKITANERGFFDVTLFTEEVSFANNNYEIGDGKLLNFKFQSNNSDAYEGEYFLGSDQHEQILYAAGISAAKESETTWFIGFEAGKVDITSVEGNLILTFELYSNDQVLTGSVELFEGENLEYVQPISGTASKKATNKAMCSGCSDTYGDILSPSTAAWAAKKFAPVLYFDKAASKFPTTGANVFANSNNKTCGQKLSLKKGINTSGSLSEAETYYQITNCSNDPRRIFITYWWTYYRQDNCFWNSGGHDYDWERIVVQVNKDTWKPSTVTYFQHKGHYTRRLHSDRATVYVGKIGHGSYHNSGGSGGCAYWADYRNPGPKWETKNNPLVELRCNGPEWMSFSGKWGNPAPSPLFRGRDYCNLKPCKSEGILTRGCDRGDYKSTQLGKIEREFN